MKWSAVLAVDAQGGIGKDGGIPWHLPADLKHFKEITEHSVVIMGRKTWESLPDVAKPLPNRINIIVTSRARQDVVGDRGDGRFEQVHTAPSLDTAMNLGASLLTAAGPRTGEEEERQTTKKEEEEGFIIGGASLYKEFFHHPNCFAIHLTKVYENFQCDVVAPPVPTNFNLVTESKTASYVLQKGQAPVAYKFFTYVNPSFFGTPHVDTPTRPLMDQLKGRSDSRSDSRLDDGQDERKEQVPLTGRHEEYQYLDLIRRILKEGVTRGDRTGVGTKSIFGARMEFSLRHDVIPCFTTKRVFWRGVVEELLWILDGSTDERKLAEKGVHIWKANASREFLDKQGFTDREEGDLGPVYGFQWRHFGATYVDCHTDYTGQGVDQVARVLHLIKTNPTSRRIILNAWNAADIDAMALPPCHTMCQFYVADGELSCQLYQRSADMGLGVPFNVASYSLLTRMLAHAADLKPGKFVHVIGDAHVYLNHEEALTIQIERVPKPFPTLVIEKDADNVFCFEASDFKLRGYKCHKKIAMQMAV